MFGKTLNCAKLQKHIAKLRNRNPYWQLGGSQAVQDICQRIERGYKLFFDHHKKDFSWKLAHRLPEEYDHLFFEDLNLKSMVKLWGRKVSDLAFSEFLEILQWVALKKDKVVHFISRWYVSSKTCSNCGHVLEKLELETRMWRCPCCQKVNDRDANAAINIKNVGASTFSLGDVSPSVRVAIAV